MKYHPENVPLEKTMNVWYVQRSGKRVCGAVSAPIRGLDRVDAETVLMGFAPGKVYGATAIARHGNFLQWGYGAAPDKMTETGQKLFVNCIVYMAGFDGQKPLVYQQASTRQRLSRSLEHLVGNDRYAPQYFPADILEKYKDDPAGLVAYYQNGIDLLYQEEGGTYRIDEDLAALGIRSNEPIENLDRFVALMADPQQVELGRRLLKRYVGVDFEGQRQAQEWLEQNRGHLQFFVQGGYRFFVLPVKPETLLE